MRAYFYSLATIAAVAALPCSAQPDPKYSVREETPRTGSRLRTDLTAPINVAVNLSYAELSVAEKSRWRNNYVDMPDTDEPPFPKRGLEALIKPIADAQQKLLVDGLLSLVATVDADGKVVEVKAIGSPSVEMTKFAARVMFLTDFTPAVCSARPCSMEFPLRFRFSTR